MLYIFGSDRFDCHVTGRKRGDKTVESKVDEILDLEKYAHFAILVLNTSQIK